MRSKLGSDMNERPVNTIAVATSHGAHDGELDLAAVQRRTLRLLFATQIISGVGFAIGSSVGALLAAEMAGVGMSGLAQSATVVGAALFAVPATTIVRRYGRRPSLTAGYGIAAGGALIIVAAAVLRSLPLLFMGFFLFGGATAAGFQARYAAVDLAPSALRGRHLSLIVWATTLGAVAGPNLAPVAGTSLAPYGIPTLGAPFVFSAGLFLLAILLLVTLLRPDPMLVAQRQQRAHATSDARAHADRRGGMRAALQVVLASPAARLGVSAMAVGHVVMVAIMSMTPVHIRSAGHDAAHTLRIVGVVISVHVAGMYAFSPVMGWLTDRFGRDRVILGGVGVLLAACAVAGTAGHNATRLGVGLLLLGLGWSATMVAGSAMLSASMSPELRPSAQGLSDLVMGLAGATAGALSGVVVQNSGYTTLTLVAAIATVPLVILALQARATAGANSSYTSL